MILDKNLVYISVWEASVIQPVQDFKLLSRTNNELRHVLRHFIDSAPNSGPLAVKIDTIKAALKSNEAILTFASLVEQYAKINQNFDNVDYQNKKIMSSWSLLVRLWPIFLKI